MSRKHQPSRPKLDPHALIEQEKERRAEVCLREVNAVLKKYRCRLQSSVMITGERVQSRVIVVPLDRTTALTPKEVGE
jgi:hypothetical protein